MIGAASEGVPVGALLAGLGALVVGGVFAAAQAALVASNRARLEPLAAGGGRRARAAITAAERPWPVLLGTQLGITVCSLVLGLVGEHAVAALLERALGVVAVPDGVARVVAVALSLAVLVLLQLVLGAMVPASIALAAPERVLVAVAAPVRAVARLATPLTWVLERLGRAGARLYGVRPSPEGHAVAAAAELTILSSELASEGERVADEAELMSRTLSFVAREVGEVMVPREHVTSVPTDATLAGIEAVVRATGRTRVLVTAPATGEVVGFVHAKDLLRLPEEFHDRALPFRPRRTITTRADEPLADVLVRMRARRVHVAVVEVDGAGARSGAWKGMVTLEDVLESIVGDIVDEADRRGVGADDGAVAGRTEGHGDEPR